MSADYRYTAPDGTEWKGYSHGTFVSVTASDENGYGDYTLSVDQELLDALTAIWKQHTGPHAEDDE